MARPNKIRLETREYTIAEEVYQRVVALVMANLVCEYCGGEYTPLCPRVALNMCINCYLRKYGEYVALTYLGVLSESDHDQTHKWMDGKGMIYLTTTTQDQRAQEYTGETLKHWGFLLPKSGTYQGREMDLYENYFVIHGNLMENSVLCIEWSKPYGEREHIPFLVYKDREPMQINKRVGIYQRAKEQHLATKDNRGYYHLHGREIAGLYESSIWEVVSDLASEEHDAQKKPE